MGGTPLPPPLYGQTPQSSIWPCPLTVALQYIINPFWDILDMFCFPEFVLPRHEYWLLLHLWALDRAAWNDWFHHRCPIGLVGFGWFQRIIGLLNCRWRTWLWIVLWMKIIGLWIGTSWMSVMQSRQAHKLQAVHRTLAGPPHFSHTKDFWDAIWNL